MPDLIKQHNIVMTCAKSKIQRSITWFLSLGLSGVSLFLGEFYFNMLHIAIFGTKMYLEPDGI